MCRFVGVNHMEAHLYASFLEDPTLELPMVVLLVSGGHTMLVEMRGHADYRLLGQHDRRCRRRGVRQGGEVPRSRLSRGSGDRPRRRDRRPEAISFPRAMLHDGLDFSFSGLKTSVVNYVRKHPTCRPPTSPRPSRPPWSTCSSPRSRRAAREIGARSLALGGGWRRTACCVERFAAAAADDGVQVFLPSRRCAPTTRR